MKHLIVIIFLIWTFLHISLADDMLMEADEFYDLRGINFDRKTLLADSSYIDKAISLYREVIADSSDSVKEEAIWKAMQAYYFKGRYTVSDSDVRKAIYDEAKNIGADGINEFPESVAIHVWMAGIWGAWGEEHGVLKAARKGVAGKIRKHCEKAIELDENFDEGSAYLILGRLHFKAPRIPLILGWPSKKKALQFLEKAHAISPQNLLTKQFLAEALYESGQRDRAIELMEEIINTDTLVRGVVEDAFVKSEVAKTLKKWQK